MLFEVQVRKWKSGFLLVSVRALGTVVRLGFCFFEASPSCTYAPYGPTLMSTWDVTSFQA